MEIYSSASSPPTKTNDRTNPHTLTHWRHATTWYFAFLWKQHALQQKNIFRRRKQGLKENDGNFLLSLRCYYAIKKEPTDPFNYIRAICFLATRNYCKIHLPVGGNNFFICIFKEHLQREFLIYRYFCLPTLLSQSNRAIKDELNLRHLQCAQIVSRELKFVH